jgi:hypothetical protein
MVLYSGMLFPLEIFLYFFLKTDIKKNIKAPETETSISPIPTNHTKQITPPIPLYQVHSITFSLFHKDIKKDKKSIIFYRLFINLFLIKLFNNFTILISMYKWKTFIFIIVV